MEANRGVDSVPQMPNAVFMRKEEHTCHDDSTGTWPEEWKTAFEYYFDYYVTDIRPKHPKDPPIDEARKIHQQKWMTCPEWNRREWIKYAKKKTEEKENLEERKGQRLGTEKAPDSPVMGKRLIKDIWKMNAGRVEKNGETPLEKLIRGANPRSQFQPVPTETLAQPLFERFFAPQIVEEFQLGLLADSDHPIDHEDVEKDFYADDEMGDFSMTDEEQTPERKQLLLRSKMLNKQQQQLSFNKVISQTHLSGTHLVRQQTVNVSQAKAPDFLMEDCQLQQHQLKLPNKSAASNLPTMPNLRRMKFPAPQLGHVSPSGLTKLKGFGRGIKPQPIFE
uniref:Uncharacterized protein n=1 Tax=Plectus sambesii TaxID=2011161 RepID=A0A914VD29_9BILA